jgi:hypothetical protein
MTDPDAPSDRYGSAPGVAEPGVATCHHATMRTPEPFVRRAATRTDIAPFDVEQLLA